MVRDTSSVLRPVATVEAKVESIGAPARSVPCAALVPCPPVKARIRPVVVPLAAAV